ncbi:MAG: hypothetical protein OIN85_08005 [Candidatus Methanoperedens sp.]|nr:hypothetical protein [Candidatus Methanoperedens sp.]
MEQRKARITIDENGRVIGTGGNANSNIAIVENQKGDKIGQTATEEGKIAWEQQRPLRFTKF